MAQNNGPKDEKLIEELYKKLNWFTFQASEEQFDADQVRTILQLLDTLDPLADEMKIQTAGDKEETVSASDVDAAFERFKNRYNITDEDLAKKDLRADAVGKDSKILPFPTEFAEEISIDAEEAKEKAKKSSAQRKHFWTTASGKVALAFIIVFAAVAFFGIGTSAVKQKPFFEVVRDGVNSMKITVTGNAVESEVGGFEFVENDIRYYETWNLLNEEYKDIIEPQYIPENMNLDYISRELLDNFILFTAIYSNENMTDDLTIRIRYFEDGYWKAGDVSDDSWNLIKVDEKLSINYYQSGKYYKSVSAKDKGIYVVEWTDFEELIKVAESIY